MELTQEQIRVVGCLMEKEATVPDTYPMTLNGLRQACNQASSRDPVVDFDEFTVQRCLDELKAAGLVRFVHPSHGARSTKYRHVVDERLDLDDADTALLGVLALRGAQTAGELRTRTERWHRFESLDEVEEALARLARREEPLVVELPREPGRHQTRWMHLLAGSPEPVVERLSDPPAAPARPAGGPERGDERADTGVADLRAAVDALQERVERLERELGL